MLVYVLKIYKLAVLGIAGLLFLASLLSVVKMGGLKELQKKLTARRHSGVITGWALLTAAVLCLNFGYSWMNAFLYGHADICLNYSKASSGLNPNSTRYNAADILCDEVLQDAITMGGLKNLNVDQLRETLSVSSPVQGDTSNKENYFITTQYRIHYNANRDTAGIDPAKLLTLVSTSYKNWFIRQFSENDDLFTIDLVDYSDMDYLDICDYVGAKTRMVYKYMSRLDGQETGFVSSKTDETFWSICQQAFNIESVMIEKLRAYVLENSISKDRNAYVGRLGFQNVFRYFDELVEAANNSNSLTAIAMFEDDMARIVLVPTYDKDNQFYMSQTRIGIDDYAEEARVHAISKDSIRNKIAINNHRMEQLMRSDVLYAKDEKAEELVDQINVEMERVCEKARTIAREFSAWEANGYMSINVPTMDDKIKGIVVGSVKLPILLLAGLLCANVTEARTLLGKRRRTESPAPVENAQSEPPRSAVGAPLSDEREDQAVKKQTRRGAKS